MERSTGLVEIHEALTEVKTVHSILSLTRINYRVGIYMKVQIMALIQKFLRY